MATGTLVFVYGSSIIFLSQSWKIYRAGMTGFLNDAPAFYLDLFTAFGGLSYLIGSILFLPSYDISDEITILASYWFITGGSCFFISSFFMFYRYFFTCNFPH